MTIIICLIAAIGLFAFAILGSREVIGKSPLRLDWVMHGLSLLVIAAVLATRGIWFSASVYLHDLWVAEDSLVKTAQGFRSSIDYFNPIGPLQQWLYGLTLLFQAPATSSLVMANAFAAGLALLLAVLLLRHRASPLVIAIVGLIAVTTAVSPRDIDAIVQLPQSTMLAPYNRWAWALLLPVALSGALPARSRGILGDVFAGIAISLLVMLKVTYGLAAGVIYVVALILWPARWRETALVAVSCLLSLLIVDLATGGQLRAYFADVLNAARMPSSGLRVDKLLAEVPVSFAFAIGSLLLLAASRHDDGSPLALLVRSWRLYVMALAVGASGTVILLQNHFYSEPVTLLLMPLIIAEGTGLTAGFGDRSWTIWKRGGEWIGAILLVTLAWPAVDTGFVLAQKVQTFRLTPIPELSGTALGGLIVNQFILPDEQGRCSMESCEQLRGLMSGLDLLRKQCPSYQQSAVLAFDFANPFPGVLPSPSPRHAPIWLHGGRTFSDATHVPPEQMLSDVGCVIVLRNNANALDLMRIYGDEMSRTFEPIGENAEWQLWVRK